MGAKNMHNMRTKYTNSSYSKGTSDPNKNADILERENVELRAKLEIQAELLNKSAAETSITQQQFFKIQQELAFLKIDRGVHVSSGPVKGKNTADVVSSLEPRVEKIIDNVTIKNQQGQNNHTKNNTGKKIQSEGNRKLRDKLLEYRKKIDSFNNEIGDNETNNVDVVVSNSTTYDIRNKTIGIDKAAETFSTRFDHGAPKGSLNKVHHSTLKSKNDLKTYDPAYDNLHSDKELLISNKNTESTRNHNANVNMQRKKSKRKGYSIACTRLNSKNHFSTGISNSNSTVKSKDRPRQEFVRHDIQQERVQEIKSFKSSSIKQTKLGNMNRRRQSMPLKLDEDEFKWYGDDVILFPESITTNTTTSSSSTTTTDNDSASKKSSKPPVGFVNTNDDNIEIKDILFVGPKATDKSMSRKYSLIGTSKQLINAGRVRKLNYGERRTKSASCINAATNMLHVTNSTDSNLTRNIITAINSTDTTTSNDTRHLNKNTNNCEDNFTSIKISNESGAGDGFYLEREIPSMDEIMSDKSQYTTPKRNFLHLETKLAIKHFSAAIPSVSSSDPILHVVKSSDNEVKTGEDRRESISDGYLGGDTCTSDMDPITIVDANEKKRNGAAKLTVPSRNRPVNLSIFKSSKIRRRVHGSGIIFNSNERSLGMSAQQCAGIQEFYSRFD